MKKAGAKCLLAITAVLLWSTYSRAQTSPLSEEWLFAAENKLITVTNLLETSKKQAPGTAYVFDQTAFKRYGAKKIEDVLPYIPGVQLSLYLKHHMQYRFRGVHNDRYNDKILLMVDGIPSRNVYYGHFSLDDRLPLEMIRSMEVILGPGSSLYGANAFAGVISLKTKDFTEQQKVSVTAQAGSFDRYKGVVSYTSPSLVITATSMDQNTHRPERLYDGNLFNHSRDEDLQAAFIKWGGKRLTLSMNWAHYEYPYIFRKTGREARIMVQPMTLGFEYKMGDIHQGEFLVRGFHLWDKRVEYDTNTATGAMTYEDQTSSLTGLDARMTRRLNDRHILIVGGSWLQDASHGISLSGADLLEGGRQQNNDNYALFVQDAWDAGRDLQATFGLRFDSFDMFDDDLNYRVALVKSLSDSSNLKLMHGTAVRIPTYREYAKDMEDTSFVQPPVNSEKMMTTELSYNTSTDHTSFEITVFSNEFKDFLDDQHTPPTVDDPAGGADEYFYNVPELITMRGVETLFDWRPAPKTEFRASLAWLDTNRLGHSIFGMAKLTGSIIFNYQFNRNHFAGASMTYKSKRGEINDALYPDDQMDAQTVFNVHAAGNFFIPGFKFRAGITNLLDEKLFDGLESDWLYNNERPGREFWAEVTWSADL